MVATHTDTIHKAIIRNMETMKYAVYMAKLLNSETLTHSFAKKHQESEVDAARIAFEKAKREYEEALALQEQGETEWLKATSDNYDT